MVQMWTNFSTPHKAVGNYTLLQSTWCFKNIVSPLKWMDIWSGILTFIDISWMENIQSMFVVGGRKRQIKLAMICKKSWYYILFSSIWTNHYGMNTDSKTPEWGWDLYLYRLIVLNDWERIFFWSKSQIKQINCIW